jgi:hypothetical protein
MIDRMNIVALAALLCLGGAGAYAQGQYPIMDRIAQRVIEKYQTSSCEQLAAERGHRPEGRRGEMQERVVRLLHQDPQMRQAFLNRVAAPIANRLFECGIIP